MVLNQVAISAPASGWPCGICVEERKETVSRSQLIISLEGGREGDRQERERRRREERRERRRVQTVVDPVRPVVHRFCDFLRVTLSRVSRILLSRNLLSRDGVAPQPAEVLRPGGLRRRRLPRSRGQRRQRLPITVRHACYSFRGFVG